MHVELQTLLDLRVLGGGIYTTAMNAEKSVRIVSAAREARKKCRQNDKPRFYVDTALAGKPFKLG